MSEAFLKSCMVSASLRVAGITLLDSHAPQVNYLHYAGAVWKRHERTQSECIRTPMAAHPMSDVCPRMYYGRVYYVIRSVSWKNRPHDTGRFVQGSCWRTTRLH